MRQQPGVVGQLRLHREQHLGRRETHFQREFDADERGLVGRQGRAGEAEQADLDTAVERDIQHRRDVDDLERGATQPRRDPERTAPRWHRGAKAQQCTERVIGDQRGPVQRLDQEEVRDLVQVVRHDQAPVQAKAEAQRRDVDDGREADRHEHAAEDGERGELVAVVVDRHGVAADRDGADAADLDQQHAVVFDRRFVLDERTGDRDAGLREAQAQAFQVELPRRRITGGAEGHDQRQVVDLRREAGERDPAVDEQAGIGARQAHPDLVDVDRAELRMHADPQRLRLAAHAQVQAIVFAEPDFEVCRRCRRARVAAAAALAQQRRDDGVATAAATAGERAQRQAELLDQQAAAEALHRWPGLRLDVHEQHRRDAADAHRRVVEQGATIAAEDADADPRQLDADVDAERAAIVAQHEDLQAIGDFGRAGIAADSLCPALRCAEQHRDLNLAEVELLLARQAEAQAPGLVDERESKFADGDLDPGGECLDRAEDEAVHARNGAREPQRHAAAGDEAGLRQHRLERRPAAPQRRGEQSLVARHLDQRAGDEGQRPVAQQALDRVGRERGCEGGCELQLQRPGIGVADAGGQRTHRQAEATCRGVAAEVDARHDGHADRREARADAAFDRDAVAARQQREAGLHDAGELQVVDEQAEARDRAFEPDGDADRARQLHRQTHAEPHPGAIASHRDRQAAEGLQQGDCGLRDGFALRGVEREGRAIEQGAQLRGVRCEATGVVVQVECVRHRQRVREPGWRRAQRSDEFVENARQQGLDGAAQRAQAAEGRQDLDRRNPIARQQLQAEAGRGSAEAQPELTPGAARGQRQREREPALWSDVSRGIDGNAEREAQHAGQRRGRIERQAQRVGGRARTIGRQAHVRRQGQRAVARQAEGARQQADQATHTFDREARAVAEGERFLQEAAGIRQQALEAGEAQRRRHSAQRGTRGTGEQQARPEFRQLALQVGRRGWRQQREAGQPGLGAGDQRAVLPVEFEGAKSRGDTGRHGQRRQRDADGNADAQCDLVGCCFSAHSHGRRPGADRAFARDDKIDGHVARRPHPGPRRRPGEAEPARAAFKQRWQALAEETHRIGLQRTPGIVKQADATMRIGPDEPQRRQGVEQARCRPAEQIGTGRQRLEQLAQHTGRDGVAGTQHRQRRAVQRGIGQQQARLRADRAAVAHGIECDRQLAQAHVDESQARIDAAELRRQRARAAEQPAIAAEQACREAQAVHGPRCGGRHSGQRNLQQVDAHMGLRREIDVGARTEVQRDGDADSQVRWRRAHARRDACRERLRRCLQFGEQTVAVYRRADGDDGQAGEIDVGAGGIEGCEGEGLACRQRSGTRAGPVAVDRDAQVADGGAQARVAQVCGERADEADRIRQVGVGEEGQVRADVRCAQRDEAGDARHMVRRVVARRQAERRMRDQRELDTGPQLRQAVADVCDQLRLARPVGNVVVGQVRDIPVGHRRHAVERKGQRVRDRGVVECEQRRRVLRAMCRCSAEQCGPRIDAGQARCEQQHDAGRASATGDAVDTRTDLGDGGCGLRQVPVCRRDGVGQQPAVDLRLLRRLWHHAVAALEKVGEQVQRFSDRRGVAPAQTGTQGLVVQGQGA